MKGSQEVLKKRNPALELFRCLLMFGVVMIHVVGHGAYVQSWATKAFDWCVCGFVFVSGYFGIRFRPSRCISLLAAAWFCSFFANLACGASVVGALRSVNGYWFLWAYVALVLFSPLLNRAVDGCDRKMALQVFVPIAFIAYFWMVMCCIPVARDYMPHSRGVSGLSFVSLIPIYLFSRFYRKFELGRCVTVRLACTALPVCAILFAIGFWYYWWIPALAVTCIAFEWFQRHPVPHWLGRCALFVAPSMFSVYILHFSGGGMYLIRSLERYFVESCGMPMQLMYWVTGIAVFCACVLCDILRRLAFLPFDSWIESWMRMLDGCYDKCVGLR